MRMATLVAILTGAVLMTGCGPTLSVHPLYTEKDVAGDLALEGKWTGEDGREVWNVQRSGDGYKVRSLEEDVSQTYDVHVVRLGDFRFLDIAPAEHPDLSIPGHLFAKVWMEGEELRVALMDSEWLKQKLAEARAPACVQIGPEKQLLLTAPTEVVRKFVLAHASEPKAFDADVARLHRVR